MPPPTSNWAPTSDSFTSIPTPALLSRVLDRATSAVPLSLPPNLVCPAWRSLHPLPEPTLPVTVVPPPVATFLTSTISGSKSGSSRASAKPTALASDAAIRAWAATKRAAPVESEANAYDTESQPKRPKSIEVGGLAPPKQSIVESIGVFAIHCSLVYYSLFSLCNLLPPPLFQFIFHLVSIGRTRS
jgi:hypothetical protein